MQAVESKWGYRIPEIDLIKIRKIIRTEEIK